MPPRTCVAPAARARPHALLRPRPPPPLPRRAGNFYTCNRFKESEDDGSRRKDESRAALDRYLHYYSRYINHHNSLKLEEKTRRLIEEKIEQLQEHGDNTWLDGQYLKDVRASRGATEPSAGSSARSQRVGPANLFPCPVRHRPPRPRPLAAQATESLLVSRHALQYTYVYAFYLGPCNHKELFEMAQRDLEMTTEDISAELEKPVEEIERLTVLHQQQMGKKRLVNLFNAVEAHRTAEAQAALDGPAPVPCAPGSQPQSQSQPILQH